MKIKFELRLQDALILNEMAKYDGEVEYDRYETRQNVTDMINALLDRSIMNFIGSEHYHQPNGSGFSMDEVVSFLNAPIVVKQDS